MTNPGVDIIQIGSEWMNKGACLATVHPVPVTDGAGLPIMDANGNLTFASKPVDFFSEDENVIKHAQDICSACPVRQQCIQFALTNHETYGVWGGATGQDLQEVQGVDENYMALSYKKVTRCLVCNTKEHLTVTERRRSKTKVQCSNCGTEWYTKKLLGKRLENW